MVLCGDGVSVLGFGGVVVVVFGFGILWWFECIRLHFLGGWV